MIPYIKQIYSVDSFKEDVEEFLDIEANNVSTENKIPIQDSINHRESNKSESGNLLSTLCYNAFETYGPSFLSAVKAVIPFVASEINKEMSEEYTNLVLLSVIELGYTRKELEIMNDPILEFESTLPPNSHGRKSCVFNSRINTALDYFYKELNERTHTA
jgi:hypothetical protein